jgi:hypothetical protein
MCRQRADSPWSGPLLAWQVFLSPPFLPQPSWEGREPATAAAAGGRSLREKTVTEVESRSGALLK